MKSKAFLTLVALQALTLISLAAFHGYERANGVLILLETRPVDPRDLLRGDYVILNYKISTLGTNLLSPPLPVHEATGQVVFVTLEKKDRFHEVVTASLVRRIPQPGQVVLAGHVRQSWSEAEVRVDYGLERYYVAEGTGNPVGTLTVEVSVPKSGRGIIREVYLDGRPYAEAMGQER